MSAAFPRGSAPGSPAAPGRRLLLVHAHPDDESITTGATMAKYAAEGAHVTLVTCTQGEEGEVIPAALAQLAPDRDDTLGRTAPANWPPPCVRWACATTASWAVRGATATPGMIGAPQNERPGCFWQADVDEAGELLAEVIREVRPQVLVTYRPDGGYGHPDHIQAHRVATRAVELAGREGRAADGNPAGPHQVDRVYWNVVPRPVLDEGFAELRAAARAGEVFPFPGFTGDTGFAVPDDVPGVVDSATEVDVTVDAERTRRRRRAAMAAHATQISVRETSRGDFFALSNGLGQPLTGLEFFQRADRAAGSAGVGAVRRR